MKVNRLALFTALQAVAPLTGKRSTMPQLNCFLVSAEGGNLRIRGSDLENDATEKVECEGDLEPVCITAHKLTELVRSGPEQVELTFTPKTSRIVCSSLGRAELATVPTKDFPKEIEDKMTAVGLNCEDLARAIESVAWCAEPPNGTRQNLMVVHVQTKAKQMIVQATDGRMLADIRLDSICAECDFIYPAAASGYLCSALRRKGATLHVGENRILVSHDSGSFSVRLMEGQFPTEGVNRIKTECGRKIGKLQLVPLLAAAKTAIQLLNAPQSYTPIYLTFSKSGLDVELKSSETEYSVTLPGDFADKVRMYIDASRLIRVLSAFDAEEVDLLTTNEKPALHFRIDHGGLCALTMLLSENVGPAAKP